MIDPLTFVRKESPRPTAWPSKTSLARRLRDGMRSISRTFALALLVALSGCASLPTDVARVSSSHTDRNGQPSRFETLARFDTVARRMRNKSFTIDNVMTNVGGRNVGDEYFGAHEDVNFGDMDALAVGPAAAEVGTQFDLYWNSALAYPVRSLASGAGDLDALRRDLEAYRDAQRDSPYAQRARTSKLVQDLVAGTIDFQWGQALVFYDLPQKLVTDPEDRSTHMGPKVLPVTVGTLKGELLIFSPYFVPGEHGVMMLTDLEKRGVQVRILTNSLASNDVGLVHAGYARYRKPLLQGGVEIYELKPNADKSEPGTLAKLKGSSGASLHAKISVFDRNSLFVGSANLDPRSGRLNTELGILFQSKPLANGLAEWFDTHPSHIRHASRTVSVSTGASARMHCRVKADFNGPTRTAVER